MGKASKIHSLLIPASPQHLLPFPSFKFFIRFFFPQTGHGSPAANLLDVWTARRLGPGGKRASSTQDGGAAL
jgi:hypothetical protein